MQVTVRGKKGKLVNVLYRNQKDSSQQSKRGPQTPEMRQDQTMGAPDTVIKSTSYPSKHKPRPVSEKHTQESQQVLVPSFAKLERRKKRNGHKSPSFITSTLLGEAWQKLPIM